MEQTHFFEGPPEMEGRADFSRCGLYRYTLHRTWDAMLSQVCFIMLNPSTADAKTDDPTTRRCLDFAMRWGYGRYVAVNLFALRSKNPLDLWKTNDPVGRQNNLSIAISANYSNLVVAAWGTQGTYLGRDKVVMRGLRTPVSGGKVYCLGLTKYGHPRFPLYLPKNTELVEFILEKAGDTSIERPLLATQS